MVSVGVFGRNLSRSSEKSKWIIRYEVKNKENGIFCH